MKYLIVLLGLFFVAPTFAQDVKKINKCIKAFDKDRSKGIEKLMKLMAKEDYPSLTAYEVLVKMEFINYESKYNLLSQLEYEVEAESEDEQAEADSSMQALIDELLLDAKLRFLDVCRRSTIESSSYTADVYLRVFMVDYAPDSSVSDRGKEYFEMGEEYFMNEKFELAELEYRKALDADPNYYKAVLYIGDSFWAREMPDSAMHFYEKARDMHPKLLEPRKYIVDALTEQGLYYRAKKECLAAFCVYPGFDMKLKFQNILNVENKWMNDHRFLRFFYPNQIGKEQRDLNGMWSDYREAKYDISKYCTDEGIIEENGKTDDKYLEVYSMRTMLDKNQDELPSYLEFAWKMKEEGYLEQYVFISMFHVDIYSQFEVFMEDEENRKKSIEYVEKYLIEKLD